MEPEKVAEAIDRLRNEMRFRHVDPHDSRHRVVVNYDDLARLLADHGALVAKLKPLPGCGHPRMYWVEGAHTPHTGDTEHHCQSDCDPGYCSLCRQVEDAVARARQRGPRIICLCGSTRFYEHFQKANYEWTMAGYIVLSVGFYPHAQKEMHHSEDVGCTPAQKVILDELHKRKIDLADEVFVLNVDGYIGSSTRSEIDYAIENAKLVRYLQPIPISPQGHAPASPVASPAPNGGCADE